MEFDKSKVYTVLNADELKVGSRVILADDLDELKAYVRDNKNSFILKGIKSEDASARFYDGVYAWYLAYLVEEKKLKLKLKWTDLKIGDVITNGRHTAMVTEIDKDCTYGMHIYAGYQWLKDDDLEEWEKVEE